MDHFQHTRHKHPEPKHNHEGSEERHNSHTGNHQDHHSHMLNDFKKRFFVSLLPTLFILLLSPMIQSFLGLGDSIRFTGDDWVLFSLSSFVFFYGGWPFLKGAVDELGEMVPGMMTLIGLAIQWPILIVRPWCLESGESCFTGNWQLWFS